LISSFYVFFLFISQIVFSNNKRIISNNSCKYCVTYCVTILLWHYSAILLKADIFDVVTLQYCKYIAQSICNMTTLQWIICILQSFCVVWDSTSDSVWQILYCQNSNLINRVLALPQRVPDRFWKKFWLRWFFSKLSYHRNV